MATKGPGVSTGLATLILGLAIGGASGYYGRYFTEPADVSAGSKKNEPAFGTPGRPFPAPAGPGAGGGAQQQPKPQIGLAAVVRNLSVLEKVQGTGLTPEQSKNLTPILTTLKSADKISDDDAKKQTDAINAILTPAQVDALAALSPRRGGRGGGGGGGAPGGGGAGGRLAPMSMGGGGGGNADPEKPFASERSAQALDELIAKVGGAK